MGKHIVFVVLWNIWHRKWLIDVAIQSLPIGGALVFLWQAYICIYIYRHIKKFMPKSLRFFMNVDLDK